jgi:hypothetical protein
VDTVGLHDTGMSAEQVSAAFGEFAEHTPRGIDVFVFVVKWGRWKPEHDAALDAFLANCGEAATAHTLVAFTHCPHHTLAAQPALRAAVEETAPASLRRLLCAVPSPPVGIDNLNSPRDARAVLQAAVSSACAAAEGARYSNEALDEARRKFDAGRESERQAFAAAVADWRRAEGPVVVEREA